MNISLSTLKVKWKRSISCRMGRGGRGKKERWMKIFAGARNYEVHKMKMENTECN